MDRRTVLAVVLMAIVIIGTQILFPSRRPVPPAADSTSVVNTPTPSTSTPSTTTTPTVTATRADSLAAPAPVVQQPASVTMLAAPKAEYAIRSPGGAPSYVRVPSY